MIPSTVLDSAAYDDHHLVEVVHVSQRGSGTHVSNFNFCISGKYCDPRTFISKKPLDLKQNCSYVAAILQLLPQIHQRGSLAAFVLRGFGDSGYVGVGLEELADPAAEDAGAVAVDHADAGQASEEGAV